LSSRPLEIVPDNEKSGSWEKILAVPSKTTGCRSATAMRTGATGLWEGEVRHERAVTLGCPAWRTRALEASDII